MNTVFSWFGHSGSTREQMDVHEEEEFDESKLVRHDQETRRIQGQLYKQLMEETLTTEDINKWKEHLDKYIIIGMCEDCLSSAVTDFTHMEVELDTERLAQVEDAIVQGQCGCNETPEMEMTVQAMKLVHIICMRDKFLPFLKKLKKLDCDMDARCSGYFPTPLHVALHYNQLEIIKFLASCDVNINFTSEVCDSPLSMAIASENDEVVNFLLQCRNININICNRRNQTLLAHCVRTRSRFVEVLLKAGADPNKTGPMMTSALMYAVQSRSVDTVKLLIRYGADVNMKNGREDSPLMIALYLGLADMMEILLDAGANPNDAHRDDGNSMLLIACYDNNIEIVKMLIRYHANVRKTNHLGYTPLHIAAWNGHLELVRMLLKAGALHDIPTSDLNTPLALAAHGGYLSVMEELLPLKCKVNNFDKDDDTPLHYAAYNGMTRAVELLIEHGADPNCRSKCQATPLWNAVYKKRKEIVKLLLKKNVVMEVPSVGTNQHSHTDHVVNIYDTPRSPLWVAVNENQPDIALLLISAGYNIQQEDWLFNDQLLQASCNNERLRNLLWQDAHSPPKLLAMSRNYFRKCFGLSIVENVKKMNIPETLKRYLTLADLHYQVDSKDTKVEGRSDSDEDSD